MLIKINFLNDKYLYEDTEFLKNQYNEGRLKGATVFARLFNIIDDKIFKVENKLEFDLSFYHIYLDDWVLLMSFIRNGYIPNYYIFDRNIKELNYCYNTCIKLGGIPSFDNYYDSLLNSDVSLNVTDDQYVYNPLNPEQDIKGKFYWRVVTSLTTLREHETVTQLIIDQIPTYYFARRPKELENNNLEILNE
tara:strand:- start:35 stop:610 length:576 start_codon:yes stop_codon:yes gene_type:complete